jgi:FecR-like protein
MQFRRRIYTALALWTSLVLSIPSDVGAQQTQSAGKITAVVPIVDVVRGAQQVPASTSQQVFWGDVINTGHLARARVALNDGSILNVGSDSNLTITKHDATQQQTDLELNYGRVRARAVKLVKPDAHYEIRTPTGVAGVVGTDFEISSDNDTTRVVVFEGKVRFCGLKKKKSKEEQQAEETNPPTPEQQKEKREKEILPCVIVAAGATSTVRFNEAPSEPVPATPLTVTEAVNSTAPSGGGGAGGGVSGGAAGGGAGGGAGIAGGTIAGIGAAVGATVATVVVRSVATTKTCSTPPPTGGAVGRRAAASCTGTTPGSVRISGQRQ